jgi:hypothetical protein
MHAFVDESVRGGQYLLVAVLVSPGQVELVRRELRRLLLPGERVLHFSREGPARRREILGKIEALPILAIQEAQSREGGDIAARKACWEGLMSRIVERDVRRLVVESREGQDDRDRRWIAQLLTQAGKGEQVEYLHLRPAEEPALWLPDAVAWAVGRGGEWRRLLGERCP